MGCFQMNSKMLKATLLLFAIMTLTSGLVAADAPIYAIKVKDIDGKARVLGEYKGKVLLIVNVASECGLTPQYAGLEQLQEKHKEKGFAVLGFPCNDFGGQEPGTANEIKLFCQKRYQVTFPLFEKLKVVGPEKHALYELLTGKNAAFPGDVSWNFGKFLIGKDGKVLQRFNPDAEPDSAEVAEAVEKALAAK
jgi:glutathione peroxidase